MVSPDHVRARIAGILTDKDRMSLQLDISKLTDETSFSRDLALDSMQQLEFCMALEDAFGLPFDGSLFESALDRFGALVDHVAQNCTEIRSSASAA